MKIKYATNPTDTKSYDTSRLREEFHCAGLMESGEIKLIYSHYDRFVFGGAVPAQKSLKLPTYNQLKSEYFLERRELGIINLGGSGKVTVDGVEYQVNNLDTLYVGKGKKEVMFESSDPSSPAKFYLNSTPAHHEYPTTLGAKADVNKLELGSQSTSNERILYQCIHDDGIQSCQLVMGITELKEGNVWNTFPPHLHDRRMEVYFYFDIPGDNLVMHFMGQPQETRHLAVRNEEAAISPPWSIHSGAGTTNYKFVWGMGGENKSFADMDSVPLTEVM
ncbi:MAG: 4-deoxy-L-threo-5-hexosulose-uronate ketol-isomerase 2 [Saprospiraceae bacterium]|nr:MAG: 4-deoxy-L-threo-5-hexosulose-uronate ketol-isomerase 2 [Saprospiraceae bacterium]